RRGPSPSPTTKPHTPLGGSIAVLGLVVRRYDVRTLNPIHCDRGIAGERSPNSDRMLSRTSDIRTATSASFRYSIPIPTSFSLFVPFWNAAKSPSRQTAPPLTPWGSAGVTTLLSEFTILFLSYSITRWMLGLKPCLSYQS